MRKLNVSYWVLAGLLLPIAAAAGALIMGMVETFFIALALTGVSSAILSLRE